MVEGGAKKRPGTVSLTYNIGSGAFKNSTLLKKLNKGDYQGAADQFLVWNKAGGKVMKGLVRRREAERALFLKK
ncbi:lysozyme [Acinetobacter nosocomialis]|nr:lysozyme [Acinetobacter nosocomialis]